MQRRVDNRPPDRQIRCIDACRGEENTHRSERLPALSTEAPQVRHRLRLPDQRPPLGGQIFPSRPRRQAHPQECLRPHQRGMRGKAGSHDRGDEEDCGGKSCVKNEQSGVIMEFILND